MRRAFVLASVFALSCSIYATPDGPLDPDLSFGGTGGDLGRSGSAGAPSLGGSQSGGTSGATGGSVSASGGDSGESGGSGVAGSSGAQGGFGGEGEAGSTSGGTSGGSVNNGGAGSSAGGATAGSGGSGAGSPVELALGKPASASSDQPEHTTAHGNDGAEGTRWCAVEATFPQSWRVDLGAVYELTSFELSWEFGNRTYDYEISSSLDDQSYSVLFTRSQSGKVQSGTMPSGTMGRYVRVNVTGAFGNTWASFYELKVYGK